MLFTSLPVVGGASLWDSTDLMAIAISTEESNLENSLDQVSSESSGALL